MLHGSPARLRFAAVLLATAVTFALACGSSSDAPNAGEIGADAGGSSAPTDAGAAPSADGALPPAATKGCNGGAAKAAPAGLASGLTLSVGGKDRSYDLSVPAGYDATRAYPVVFVFHGGGGSAQSARTTFKFESIAAEKAVFVYPQGLGDWDLDSPADTNQDVAFFDDLLAKLEGDLCVDAARVFATGLSNGAYFSNQLGCRRGAKLRALAAHAGGGPYENDGNGTYDENGNLLCAGGTAPAVLLVHGESDDVVPLSEGQGSLKHWKWANHCNDDTTARDPAPCVGYGGCAVPVVWCQIPSLGHQLWGQGTAATWAFFASF